MCMLAMAVCVYDIDFAEYYMMAMASLNFMKLESQQLWGGGFVGVKMGWGWHGTVAWVVGWVYMCCVVVLVLLLYVVVSIIYLPFALACPKNHLGISFSMVCAVVNHDSL